MAKSRRRKNYKGMLVIGDPHIEARQPGFRCDDYANTILDKVQWCLDYAAEQNLLPVFLGDFFDKPRDNPTWLIGRLIDLLLPHEVIGIYGNHDCSLSTLTEDDSLSILIKSDSLKLVDETQMWRGRMGERTVMIGGSSYRQPIPQRIELPQRETLFDSKPLVLWLTHHDISSQDFKGPTRIEPREIENVDLVINGHIHQAAPPVMIGQTQWLTPGNISRRSRKEAHLTHVPQVLNITVTHDHYLLQDVVVPHLESEEVFHPLLQTEQSEPLTSSFVAGLRELQSQRTASGAGLHEFSNHNLQQFSPAVAKEIRLLAEEVTGTSHDS